jgi:trk system potassium uptake protein TrkH
MFVGGCAGSTSGGMKVLRLYLLGKFVAAELQRLIHPQAIVLVRMRQQTIPRDVMTHVIGFAVLYLLVFATGTLLVALLGFDMPTSFGAVAATLDNFSAFPTAGKWLLSFLMLLGRLELYTVLILFAPAYWRR